MRIAVRDAVRRRNELTREPMAWPEKAMRDKERRWDDEWQGKRAQVTWDEGRGCSNGKRRSCLPGRSSGRSARG